MKNPKNIAITGASSGLGRALACHYAAPGVSLYLHGRSRERLQDTAKECEAKGALVQVTSGDVADGAAMAAWLAGVPVDLMIANAGVSAGMGGGGESHEQARRIFATNVDGVMNSIYPLLPLMLTRRKGQIAVISSLAGIRGLPSSPAYSASKAAVRFYGEALRGWLGKSGIEVSVVCPGYIKTAMTDVNDFPMPFIMTPEKAAAIIADGLARNQSRIAFPRRLYWPLWLISCLPTAWTDAFFAALPAKPSL